MEDREIFIFTCKRGEFVEIIYKTDTEDWSELFTEFTHFLRGCGFVIPELEITEKEDE